LLHTFQDYHRRVETELEANLELADSVGLAFRNYTEGVWHTAEILATTLYRFGEPMPRDRAQEILTSQAMAHPSIDAFAWFDAKGALLAASNERFSALAPYVPHLEPFSNGPDRL